MDQFSKINFRRKNPKIKKTVEIFEETSRDSRFAFSNKTKLERPVVQKTPK